MAFTVHNEARGRTVQLCVDLAWAVHFACENGHGGRWTAAELAARFPPEATLDAIAERLKCQTCGARTGGLTIMQDSSADGRARTARTDPGLPGAYDTGRKSP